MERDNQQEYTAEFVTCVLIPASLSFTMSVLMLTNFFIISRNLQSFIYHQISACFAIFDIIQTTGSLLGSPAFLLNVDYCLIRNNLFLCGSFMKVMIVLFDSCLIYYVIFTSTVPTFKSVSIVVLVGIIFCLICLFFMIFYKGAEVLCTDPVEITFLPHNTTTSESLAFFLPYVALIIFSFSIIVGLLVRTFIRLQSVFNSALLQLLHRPLLCPLIFCVAFLPSIIYQVINMVSNGRNGYILFLQRVGVFGVNLTGALYGYFYVYSHISDARHRDEPISNDDNNDYVQGHLSWTNDSNPSSPGSETITSLCDEEQQNNYMLRFFSQRLSRSILKISWNEGAAAGGAVPTSPLRKINTLVLNQNQSTPVSAMFSGVRTTERL
jgi:hypothetical protein